MSAGQQARDSTTIPAQAVQPMAVNNEVPPLPALPPLPAAEVLLPIVPPAAAVLVSIAAAPAVAAASAVALLPAVARPNQLTNQPPTNQRQDYGPQANWGRNLTPMTAYQVSVENRYLSQSTKMTQLQQTSFWQA
jgi:hypothetical protein